MSSGDRGRAHGPDVAGVLTYRELADQIEQAFGVRPALSTLRAAAADSRRGTTRTRLTAGLPPPVRPSPAGPALFDTAAVQAWLAGHPWRRLRQEQERLMRRPAAQRPQAVAEARRAGLSWRQIADALSEADRTSYTRQWAQQRYRDA